jgi:hypothetical protein
VFAFPTCVLAKANHLTVEARAIRIKQEYAAFKDGPPEAIDQMYSDLAAHGVGDELLPALTRMRNAIKDSRDSATRICRNNEGIMVFSMVIYAGNDQAARQASAVVVGDSFSREILQENVVNVKQALNGVVDTVRYVWFDLWFVLVLTFSWDVYSAKLALKKLAIAAGNELPDDIAPLVENLPGRLSKKKVVEQALALHQEEIRNKKIEHRSIKRLGNEDVGTKDATKMPIQYLRNRTTSYLKDHFSMWFNSCSLTVSWVWLIVARVTGINLEEGNFPWADWDKRAITLKICLVGWSAAVPACPGSTGFKYNKLKRGDWAVLNKLTDGRLRVEPWSEGKLSFSLDIDLPSDQITDEKLLEVGSVEYGEIALVMNLAGEPLLQVKDRKAGNVRSRKRTAAKTEAYVASINRDVEDSNSQEVITFPPMVDEEEISATPMPVPRPQQSLVNYVSSGATEPPPSIPPKKQVKFNLLPGAGAAIPSVPKPPHVTMDRTAKIRSLQAELATLQANAGREEEFMGYEVLDVPVSSDPYLAAGDYGLPEIRLRTSKPDTQFLHAGHFPPAMSSVPRVSPMSFYQQTAVLPSARNFKGKQRAFPRQFAERPSVDLPSPSVALRAQLDAYSQQRQWYSGDGAGPSRGRYNWSLPAVHLSTRGQGAYDLYAWISSFILVSF